MPRAPKNNIIKFFRYTINRAEEQILYKWLQKEEQNTEVFCQLLEKWDADQQMSKEKIRQSWNKLQKILEASQIRLHFNQWLRYAAAASVLFIVSFGGWFLSRTNKTELHIAQYNVVNLDNTIQKHVLPDNSIVWLHKGSSITYSETFMQNRQVELEGQAYFEVQKDMNNHFIVHTDKINITVTGTEFEVDAQSKQNILVTLVTGSVNVAWKDTKDTKDANSHIKLTPGKQACIDRESGSISINDVDAGCYAEWKSGRYCYKNEILENIAKQLSYHYHINISIEQALKNIHFTGEIAPDFSIEKALELIADGYPMKYEIISPDSIHIFTSN